MSKELSPAAALARYLNEKGPRTVSTLEKEGFQNVFRTALDNMHQFTISAGRGPSPVIALWEWWLWGLYFYLSYL